MIQNGLKAPEGEQEKFIYRVSHDLQEPARGTKAYLTLLEKKLGQNLSPEAKQFMQLAHGQMDVLQAMIKGLVDLSRVRRNTEEPQSFDFIVLLEQIQQFYSHKLAAKKWMFDSKETAMVFARFGQMRQAMQLIIDNVLNHSPEATLKWSVQQTDGMLIWSIMHQNASIPEHSEEMLFELFYSTKKKEGHVGLGLALAKSIVENNGGKLSARRLDDSSWELYLHLPIKAA